MIRQIIKIDQQKCNGCGACATACHEGAIEMVNGKAVLTRENYCDGLGDCLPACPMNAITFEQREAPAYDEAAVLRAKAMQAMGSGCPGSRPRTLQRSEAPAETGHIPSGLAQWPCQLKLMPLTAPYYEKAHLLIAADCAAFACGSFHRDFMQGKVTLIGCPKLDAVDYAEKLSYIFENNDIEEITVARMEVPCCGGLVHAVNRAVAMSGKNLKINVHTLSTGGKLLV